MSILKRIVKEANANWEAMKLLPPPIQQEKNKVFL